MGEYDSVARDLASSQNFLITTAQADEVGIPASAIRERVENGRWIRRQAGVYQVDTRPQEWDDRVLTAVLAAGPGALASHRCAFKLWNLDGLGSVPIEITVPFGQLPVPEGVIVHRTRRVMDIDEVGGIPATTVPRTLLDCASFVPPVVLAKAVDAARRNGFATLDELKAFLIVRGGRGVAGTRKLQSVLEYYAADIATDSNAEAEALFHLRDGHIPEPVLQQRFLTRNGPRRPDFYWPELNKAVEVDGLGTHSSADAIDDDLIRQNDLLELGIELRRFSARQVRRDPRGFVADVRRFLDS